MADSEKDWLQLAIEEKHIDVFDFENFVDPKFIANGSSGAVYMVRSKRRTTKKYALKYLLQPISVEDDQAGYADFVNEVKLTTEI